jgi:transposase
MKEDTRQRDHDLREVFNGLRWIVRAGAQWRMMPRSLPPWYTVYQQAQRWIVAGVFEDMVHDLRALLRLAKGKKEEPSAAIFDGRAVQSTPESGERAGYNGRKRRKGSKIRIAVDHLGLLLAARVTPANEQERAQVKELAETVQEVTHNSVEVAFVDQGCTGDTPRDEARKALSCCPDVGWWSAVLPGRHASAAWLATLRDARKPSARFTSWPLPSSCYKLLLKPLLISSESAEQLLGSLWFKGSCHWRLIPHRV